jgi:hypothetical protein
MWKIFHMLFLLVRFRFRKILRNQNLIKLRPAGWSFREISRKLLPGRGAGYPFHSDTLPPRIRLGCKEGAEAFDQARAEAEEKRREGVKIAVAEQPRNEQGRMMPKEPDGRTPSAHPGDKPPRQRNEENRSAHTFAQQAGVYTTLMTFRNSLIFPPSV